jgi:hypothetical protein
VGAFVPVPALSIDVGLEKIRLQTLVRTFRQEIKNHSLDLYSIVHVADKSYYQDIERRFGDYDYVLVELITPLTNTLTTGTLGLKQLITPVYSPKAAILAEEYGLASQLDALSLSTYSNVYIADLDSSTVTNLESEQKSTTLSKFLTSVFRGGRTEEKITLKKFFLPDTALTAMLRALCWYAMHTCIPIYTL